MKKNIVLFLSICATVAVVVSLSSCSKDDPPAKAKLSFTATTAAVNEADGIVEVEVSLDKAASEDIVIEYSLKGTAGEKSAVASDDPFDYEDLNEGEVEIKKGEKTGVIELQLYSDPYLEDPETIEISIENAGSKVEITREDETEITLNQEDGLIITLAWPNPTTGQQADMDMFVRIGETTTTLDDIFTGSVRESFQSGEIVFIPYVFDDAAFGASYVYYEGTLNPLNFTVRFIDLVNGQLEAEAQRQTFQGSYTLANINKWEDANTTKVVQTFKKVGNSFNEITPITPAVSGSRVSTGLSSKMFVKQKASTPNSKLYERIVKGLK